MIQSGLFFVLGFLLAGFLALLVAPAIWRRAVYLTRKRIESAVPLTANELQADKDKLRAEHAIELRKVELSRDKQRKKNTEHANNNGKLNEQIKLLKAEITSQDEVNAQLEKTIFGLNERLTERDGQLDNNRLELSTTSAELSARTGEVESLARLQKDAKAKLIIMEEKGQQFELQAAKLKATVSELRSKRQEDQAKIRETRTEGRATAELLKNERGKIADRDKKFERLVSKNSDLEAKLSRREREIQRLRDKKQGEEADVNELATKLADSEAERLGLDNELANATRSLNRMSKLAGKTDPAKAFDALQVKVAQMELDLKSLSEERKDLKQKLAEKSATLTKSAKTAKSDGDEILREQLSQLAAEVVHMTAIVEGKTSRINSLLNVDSPKGPDGVISLADRIQALRQQAKAAE